MALIFLPRKIDFDDGLLLRREARGGLRELLGERRFVLKQRITLLRDDRQFLAALLVRFEFDVDRV